MTTRLKKPTLRSALNQMFRSPQRTEVTKLDTKAVSVRSVFKNKHIIEVHAEVHPRFAQNI